MKNSSKGLLSLAALLGAAAANATVITSLHGGSVFGMPPGDGNTWTANNYEDTVVGYQGYMNFGQNGYWTGALGPMAAEIGEPDGGTVTMTFTFPSPVRAVGGFINYAPGFLNTIAVYHWGHLIEQTTLLFGPLGANVANRGRFLGFEESTADITSFTLSTTGSDTDTSGLAITHLTDFGSTPEPGVLLLFGSGLLLLGASRRSNGARF